jgi:hypothetical protein
MQHQTPVCLVRKSKFLVPALLVFSIPITYIIKKHLDWKPNPDSKKRMLIHHLFFWPLFFLGIGIGHNARKTYKTDLFKTAGWLGAGMSLMIAGFEGGDRLARYLVPKTDKPQPPMPFLVAPAVFSYRSHAPAKPGYPLQQAAYSQNRPSYSVMRQGIHPSNPSPLWSRFPNTGYQSNYLFSL